MDMNVEYAEGWRPEEGDTIIGTVTDVGTGWSNYGGGQRYPIVTITPEDGGEPVAVHCFHAALMNRMRELRPTVGERIGIQYKGQRPHKTDATRTVSVYVVRMDRAAANVWDTFGAEVTTPAPGFIIPDVPADTGDFAPAGASSTDDDDIPF